MRKEMSLIPLQTLSYKRIKTRSAGFGSNTTSSFLFQYFMPYHVIVVLAVNFSVLICHTLVFIKVTVHTLILP